MNQKSSVELTYLLVEWCQRSFFDFGGSKPPASWSRCASRIRPGTYSALRSGRQPL